MAETILEVENLTKIYNRRRGKETLAVDDISFSVRSNEVVGLLGPNGAGKTTTIKCICTLIGPTKGAIHINGSDAIKSPRSALRHVAAVLEGNRNIYWRLSVRENLEFFACLHGIPARRARSYIDQLIELFQLKEKERTEARKLSRGMQQKLAVACALVKKTDLLLLDEPTLGLDVEISHELRFALKEMAQRGERTIIISSHDMGVVRDICDRVIIINQGRIITDETIADLLERFKVPVYRLVIEGHLSEHERRRLKERFELIKITESVHQTEVEVESMDEGQLDEVMDALKPNATRIEMIEGREPSFERIFLKILKGGGG